MTRNSPHWHGDAPLPVPLATRIEGFDTVAFPVPGQDTTPSEDGRRASGRACFAAMQTSSVP